MNDPETLSSHSVRHPFYTWPQPDSSDDAVFDELRQRRPSVSNIEMGVAVLRARQMLESPPDIQTVADIAEKLMNQHTACLYTTSR